MLDGFQPDADVKALIFMPGATDELYFFHRVDATLTNPQPSLMDAVVALTNQTPLRVTFRTPFLLLHSDEDVLDLDVRIQHLPTVEKLRLTGPMPHWIFNDRDWDFLLKSVRKPVKVTLLPRSRSADSWHFYRHSFASWNLSAWEALQAAALAGKTRLTVRRGMAGFQPDPRLGVIPKLDHFPH